MVRQRALLHAAVFGRAFAADVPRDLLRSVALKLRLLNALREPDVGMPLTMPQLEALSLPVVVSRCAGWPDTHVVCLIMYHNHHGSFMQRNDTRLVLRCNALVANTVSKLHITAAISSRQYCLA